MIFQCDHKFSLGEKNFHELGHYLGLSADDLRAEHIKFVVANSSSLSDHVRNYMESSFAVGENPIEEYCRMMEPTGVCLSVLTLWMLGLQYKLHIGVLMSDDSFWSNYKGLRFAEHGVKMLYMGRNLFEMVQPIPFVESHKRKKTMPTKCTTKTIYQIMKSKDHDMGTEEEIGKVRNSNILLLCKEMRRMTHRRQVHEQPIMEAASREINRVAYENFLMEKAAEKEVEEQQKAAKKEVKEKQAREIVARKASLRK